MRARCGRVEGGRGCFVDVELQRKFLAVELPLGALIF